MRPVFCGDVKKYERRRVVSSTLHRESAGNRPPQASEIKELSARPASGRIDGLAGAAGCLLAALFDSLAAFPDMLKRF